MLEYLRYIYIHPEYGLEIKWDATFSIKQKLWANV